MRRMSFSLTEPQLLNGSKTETRRVGWSNLKPGDKVLAVRKAMGLKKGEKQVVLGTIMVLSNDPVRLGGITLDQCVSEGFPEMSPPQFVAMFCKHMGVRPTDTVHRIRFTFKAVQP